MRFKYRPPINDWATGARQQLCKASAFYFKPEYPPRVTKGMFDLKWHQESRRYVPSNLRHRNAVGIIRALGVPNFFRGAYHGAEND